MKAVVLWAPDMSQYMGMAWPMLMLLPLVPVHFQLLQGFGGTLGAEPWRVSWETASFQGILLVSIKL